jgi:hypothetical protein
MVMIALIAATSIASAPAQPEPRGMVFAQANASVRILPGARILAGKTPQDAITRDSVVRESNGDRTSIRLIEFP